MATKVKPSRIKVTGTPQAGQVPVYVDQDNFEWKDNGEVSGPASSTDGDIVLFDGATGKLIKDSGVALSSKADAADLNTKTFYLSSTSDLTTAQAALDRYLAGKNPIVVYSEKAYILASYTSTLIKFSDATNSLTYSSSYSNITNEYLDFYIGSGIVTDISLSRTNLVRILQTNYNYGTPYTPQYDGSPATKKYVDDKVADLMGLGKFLSLWDATTGQPISFPLQTPYTYSTGDYFLVETISSATPPVNYRPNGSSYTGTASSTAETEELEVGDIYIYDGTTWLLQLNHGKTVSFSEIAGNPSDNTALSNALGAKQDALTLPATPTQGNLVTWGADNETLVDGGAVPTGVPSGGNNGDVLTNVSGTPTWQAPSGGYSTITVTLTSAGWTSKSQTVSATGVTASNTVLVSPAPDDIQDYADCGVYCSVQGSGTLTFGCDTAPSGDIVVNVLIFN